MGWFFGRKKSTSDGVETATVKKFKPAEGGRKAFAFVFLNKDKREVYVGPDVLSKAKILTPKPGQAVNVKHEPSQKRPGTLQATVISA